MNYEVVIRQPGHGMDELTTGTISADSIDFQDPENFIGETIRVQTYDSNGDLVEYEGILIKVL